MGNRNVLGRHRRNFFSKAAGAVVAPARVLAAFVRSGSKKQSAQTAWPPPTPPPGPPSEPPKK